MSAKQPLIEAMLKYEKENVYPFHTPGHKGGRGMLEPLKSILGERVLQMDVSLMAELDDLHEPTNCLREAQYLAAKLYGSEACFFGVNGTTGAIHAMLLGALNPGDKILVPRNCHRSVSGGIFLGELNPIYIMPEYLPEFGIYGQITLAQIEEIFAKEKDIKAVFLTSPNYYGLTADIQAIADFAHKKGAKVLVDEAHGPHLGFSELLPISALQAGADAVAQSTHKLLGAMTQASMLLAQGKRIDLTRMADVMSLLTTTSPNYLLMASLDAARAQLEDFGPTMSEEAVAAALKIRNLLNKFADLNVLSGDVCGQAGIKDVDLTKITVNVKGLGLTGIRVGEVLREANFAVELVDEENILLLITYADFGPELVGILERLEQVFAKLARENHTTLETKFAAVEMPKPVPAISFREVFAKRKKVVPLKAAIGKIAGENISFYPPGIPAILAGEVFTKEIYDYCVHMNQLGIAVHGPIDSNLDTLRIIED